MTSVRAWLNSGCRCVVIGGLLLVWVMPGGCATQPMTSNAAAATDDPLAAVPDDLTVDLRVLTPPSRPGSGTEGEPQPSVRAARYVLMPDGTLFAGFDGLHHERDLPPEIRRLPRRQLAEVWALLSELGFTSPESAEPMRNPLLIDRPESGALYVLGVRGHDQWWQIRRRSSDADADDSAMARLAEHLSNLAWLVDDADRAARITPRRYDFGPDPYAQYRGRD